MIKIDNNDKMVEDDFEQNGERFKLNCINDNSPLGFEKSLSPNLKKMEAQDPLEEINLGTKENRKPTYVSNLRIRTSRKNCFFIAGVHGFLCMGL